MTLNVTPWSYLPSCWQKTGCRVSDTLGPCTALSPPEIAPSLVFMYKLGFRVSGLPAVLAQWVSPKLPFCAGWTREGPAITSSWVSSLSSHRTDPPSPWRSQGSPPSKVYCFGKKDWGNCFTGLEGAIKFVSISPSYLINLCVSLCTHSTLKKKKKKNTYTHSHRKRWKEGFF